MKYGQNVELSDFAGPGGIPEDEITEFNDKVNLKKKLNETTNRLDAAIDFILGISSIGWEFLGCLFLVLSAICQSSKSIKSS